MECANRLLLRGMNVAITSCVVAMLLMLPTHGGDVAGSLSRELIAMINDIIPEEHMQRIAPSLVALDDADLASQKMSQSQREQRSKFVGQLTAALSAEAKAYSNAHVRSADAGSLTGPVESPFAHVLDRGSVSSDFPYFGMIPKVDRRTLPFLGVADHMGFTMH